MSELTLKTDQIGELAFRAIAGLCDRCGHARREPNSELCSGCEYIDQTRIQSAIRSIEVARMSFIKKKIRESRSAA